MTLYITLKSGGALRMKDIDDFGFMANMLVGIKKSAITPEAPPRNVNGIATESILSYEIEGESDLVRV